MSSHKDTKFYTKDMIDFVKERYDKDHKTTLKFNDAFQYFTELKKFDINGNVYDDTPENYDDDVHLIMRLCVQYYINGAFEMMKVNPDDPNVTEDLSDGNIGTPGRIAKVWCGSNTNDDSELGCGRWSKKPRVAWFPNNNQDTNIPITKRVDIVSNCSHHGITFSTLARSDSYAVISYIPDKFVLGISKLQRLTNWVAKRFWLQEDLTKAIYEEISQVAQTDSVYVKIVNAVHGCETFRGSKSKDGAFSSEMYGGKFTSSELRNEVQRSIR